MKSKKEVMDQRLLLMLLKDVQIAIENLDDRVKAIEGRFTPLGPMERWSRLPPLDCSGGTIKLEKHGEARL